MENGRLGFNPGFHLHTYFNFCNGPCKLLQMDLNEETTGYENPLEGEYISPRLFYIAVMMLCIMGIGLTLYAVAKGLID